MMMRNVILLVIFVLISGIAQCQIERTLMKEMVGEDSTLIFDGEARGEVAIFSDRELNNLLRHYITFNKYREGFPGWRIQIFFGSGSNSGENARKVKTNFLDHYPDIDAYLKFEAPYFKVRVGNFRLTNKSAALRLKNRISAQYPDCWIVKDYIEYPKLDRNF